MLGRNPLTLAVHLWIKWLSYPLCRDIRSRWSEDAIRESRPASLSCALISPYNQGWRRWRAAALPLPALFVCWRWCGVEALAARAWCSRYSAMSFGSVSALTAARDLHDVARYRFAVEILMPTRHASRRAFARAVGPRAPQENSLLHCGDRAGGASQTLRGGARRTVACETRDAPGRAVRAGVAEAVSVAEELEDEGPDLRGRRSTGARGNAPAAVRGRTESRACRRPRQLRTKCSMYASFARHLVSLLPRSPSGAAPHARASLRRAGMSDAPAGPRCKALDDLHCELRPRHLDGDGLVAHGTRRRDEVLASRRR
ncbi:hypothetical protein M885DRAFT_87309 [Pelagophyceae sp. CCMP2097]|nr:hypothetical protein M885DRAFT_87309 [Pelagophyceae sp. CCMP2097]